MLQRSLVVLVLPLLNACQASASAQMQAKSQGDVGASADGQAATDLDARASKSAIRASAPESFDGQAGYADPATGAESSRGDTMLGARAGLRLSKPSAAKCQCLGVVVGQPSEPGLTWEGPMPRTNPETQLVIGLSSEGLPCPAAPKDSLGASYRGYELVGPDVMVMVETARFGRPVAQGAVIPKPLPGGSVFVRASDGTSPYGRSLDGHSATCNVWPKS